MTARARAALLLCTLLAATALPAHAAPEGAWRTAWSNSPDSAGPALSAQTLRQVVRASTAGSRVRVRLSNLYGTAPLAIGTARVALSAGGARIAPASDRQLTFGGRPGATIAPGASVLSDPVDLAVPALRPLAVSLYLPHSVPAATIHGAALQTAYIGVPGDATAAPDLPAAKKDDTRWFLADVEVLGGGAGGTLAIVGDSIADGIGAGDDRDARWPDALAARLQADPAFAGIGIGIANGGIAGNRLLRDGAEPYVGPSALARFERDALDKPGVRWVLVHEGLNDITANGMLAAPAQHATVAELRDGLRTLAARARERGIRIWAGTMTPLAGTKRFHSAAVERDRQAMNAWIRTAGVFDAVVDFDAALRDPADASRLNPAFDSGDHLHPNEAGYRAMAQQVDLALLRP